MKEEGRLAIRTVPHYIGVDILTMGIEIFMSEMEKPLAKDAVAIIVYTALFPDSEGKKNTDIMQAILDILNYLDDEKRLSARAIAETVLAIRDEKITHEEYASA